MLHQGIEKGDSHWSRDRLLAACLVAVALLLVAAFGANGESYYTFLRIYVSGAASLIALLGWRQGEVWWPLSAVLLAILFNPIRPIDMNRDDWFWCDLGAAAWFAAVGARDHVRTELDFRSMARRGWPAAAIILALAGIAAWLRQPATRAFGDSIDPYAEARPDNSSLLNPDALANADETLNAVMDMDATDPADPLGDAFEAATGHRQAFTEVEKGDVVTTRPVRIVELPFGPALITAREIKDGCHACAGALGLFYLKRVGTKTTVVASWPEAVTGWGWGAPPSKWQLTDKFTSFPAIYASGGYSGQGVTEESATLTELRPGGPVTSDVIWTGFSDEGAIVDNERPACVVTGKIANIRKDRSFDVLAQGSLSGIDHYVQRNGKFVRVSKLDWELPCDR